MILRFSVRFMTSMNLEDHNVVLTYTLAWNLLHQWTYVVSHYWPNFKAIALKLWIVELDVCERPLFANSVTYISICQCMFMHMNKPGLVPCCEPAEKFFCSFHQLVLTFKLQSCSLVEVFWCLNNSQNWLLY